MSACPACDRAKEQVHHGLYHFPCESCTARMLAIGLDGHYWRKRGDESILRAIARAFPDQRRGKRLVWEWSKLIEAQAQQVS